MSTIRVISSLATKHAYETLVPQFARTSGHQLETTWGGTSDINKRIAAGEVFDTVIASAAVIDALVKAGKVRARLDIARCGIGVAVPSGARRPDISSVAALKASLLQAATVAYSSGPSGQHVAELLKSWGVAGRERPKITQAPSGSTIGDYLVRGEAEIGFQMVSELATFAGIDYVGPLPEEAQQIVVFSGGVHTQAIAAGPAQALLAFLTSDSAAAAIRKTGMEPA